MGFDSPREGASLLLNSYFDSHMDEPHQPGSSSISKCAEPSPTVVVQTSIKDQSAVITPPPDLRLRAAFPQPQNPDSCQQAEDSASRSASQAIQQANQLASDSIRQASQQASQSADAASRSATEGIRQAKQSADQSISAASRSVSSAISSASSAISSISKSAADAISKANAAQSNAQVTASNARIEASSAILQAGAAVAAATGQAAAAGSSFLAAASLATVSAQASVSAFGSAAASQLAQASQQVSQSQTTAITATQIAIAIVGSIIASTLITILVFFLVARHKKKAKRKADREREQQSPGPSPGTKFSKDPKFPASEKVGSPTAESRGALTGTTRNDPGRANSRANSSTASFSLFPKTSPPGEKSPSKRVSEIRSTSVPWNPSNPPKPPSLGSWLKLQDGVSPFGPIKLPTDEKTKAPLGGQLKSPLRGMSNKSQSPLAPRFVSNIPVRSPTIPRIAYRNPIVVASDRNSMPLREDSVKRKPVSPDKLEPDPILENKDIKYRESKASVWTDDIPDSAPSTPFTSSPVIQRANTATKVYPMQIPSPKKPVRNTAEWLLEQQHMQSTSTPRSSSQIAVNKNLRPTFALSAVGGGLPRTSRMGLPSGPRPGPDRNVKSIQGEMGYFEAFVASDRESNVSRYPSDRSTIRTVGTPGVGKAM